MKPIDLRVTPISTERANAYWLGESDANGQTPERHISDGSGIPCRHCLSHVIAGSPYLALSYRPFNDLQPYAECGPIFLHAEPCSAYQDSTSIPAMCLNGEPRIVRGYDAAERIIYGSGKIVEPDNIASYARELFSDINVNYIHVRSSQNNCYTFRIDRHTPDEKS